MSFIGAAIGAAIGSAAIGGTAAIIGGAALGGVASIAKSSKKQASRLAAQAEVSAAAQTKAIQAQTKAMTRKAVTPPPPPPPAPVAAPIRQAAPGTGSQVLSPAMLIRRAGKPTTKRTNQGQTLGYGSRL